MKSKELIYGYHALKTLLQKQAHLIKEVYVQANRRDERLREISALAAAQGISIQKRTKDDFDSLLPKEANHQGMLAVCRETPGFSEMDLKNLLAGLEESALLLILDGVQDPHNLGACLRTANAMGVDAVIAPKDRAVGLTPTVKKVASGAALITPFVAVTNLARTLRWLKEAGVWLVGMDAETETTLVNVDLTGSIAIVMGGEGEGLRQLTRKHCDYLAKIPMQGAVESLNVSVATGMCLYEVQRQRSLIDVL